MNIASKITQKLAALVVVTAGVCVSSPFADNAVNAQNHDEAQAAAKAEIGKAAPQFKLDDTKGKTVDLSKLAGKVVVLEWFNHGCPFVKKHYDSNNMQSLQKEYTGKGVVWLSICSSAKGKQGNATAQKHDEDAKTANANPSHILIDQDGQVGRLNGAKTTPHMFVIDKKGILVYAGAIDDKPSTDAQDVKNAKNYVKAALDEVLKNKPVSVASTKAYGCSVKY